MLATLLIVTALLAALAWTWPLRGRLVLPERLAAAGVAAVVGAAWVSFLLVLVLGFRAGMVAAPAVLAALAALGVETGRAAAARARAEGTAVPPWRRMPGPLVTTWLTATGLFTTGLFYLYSTHFLLDRDGGMGSGGSTWGDLAMHASLTSRFAQEPRFEWGFPLLVGAPLTYPFLPDFLSGVLVRGGLSLRWGLLLPTLLLAAALVQLLFFAGWRGGRSARAAVFLLLLVLLDGSVAGVVVFVREWWGSGTPLLDYLAHASHDFAHVPAINVRFSNIICDALLPQRGMLAGMSIFLLAVLLLRLEWERRRARREAPAGRVSGPLIATGMLLGALPLVHIHTFLVLAGVTVWLALAEGFAAWLRSGKGGKAMVPWLATLALGILLAAPQLWWQLSHTAGGSFSHWQLGWMAEAGENPFTFWLKNLGVLLPLLVLAPALLERWPARGFWTQLVAACLAVFAVANVYLFQPHAYDNLKLLFYSYLALAILGARLVAAAVRRGGWRRPVALVLLLLAITSGALSVLRESLLRWPFLTAEEVRLGYELQRRTPPDARFLVVDHHNHPVPMVAGRQVVLGYRGWLWTYGWDTNPVLADVRAMYGGGWDAPELLREYGVDFVVIGPGERKDFDVDEAFFAARYPLLIETPSYRVYRVLAGGGVGVGTKTGVPPGSLPAKRTASK